MLVSVLGWAAFVLGLIGTWLLPRTRHGWLLSIACGIAWVIVDALIGLWSGLAAGLFSLVANWRCWRRGVTGTYQVDTEGHT